MKQTVHPKFVDHYPTFDANSGYACTNEEPILFHEMLGKRRFNKSACIASGGEILLSVVMPRSDEIYAVDHSYKSLNAACVKALLMQKMGVKAFSELLDTGDQNLLNAAMSKHLYAQLPDGAGKMLDPKFAFWDSHGLRREWRELPKKNLTQAVKKIGNTTFVHGDITDLAKLYGQFDLVYASNAMEHTGRDHKALRMQDLANLLVVGGLLLYTNSTNYKPVPEKPMSLVDSIRGYRTSWNHIVLQKDA